MENLRKIIRELIAEALQTSPAQLKNAQALYGETQQELKTLLAKVNAEKAKGVNTPQYRQALYHYYGKNLESLGFLDKLNKLQGKNINLKPQTDVWQKRMDQLKKAQAQARQTTIQNVQGQTQKNIQGMQSQQQANVAKAKQDSKDSLADYQAALRKWYEGGKKGPQPQPPVQVSLPKVQAPQTQLPANFMQPQTLKPTGLKEDDLSERGLAFNEKTLTPRTDGSDLPHHAPVTTNLPHPNRKSRFRKAGKKKTRNKISEVLNESSTNMESVYRNHGFDVQYNGNMSKDGVSIVLMQNSVYEVWNGQVMVYPASSGENVDIIELISIPEDAKKSKGTASKILDEIIEISSEHNRTLQLYPLPLEGGTMGFGELESWYSRKGFVKRKDGIIMEKKP